MKTPGKTPITGNLQRVHLIRHAAYEGLDYRIPRYIGRTDRAVSDVGRQQAEETRPHTTHLADFPLFTSPLRRARDTAELLFPDRNKQISPQAVEVNYGALEGLSVEEAFRLYPEEFAKRRRQPIVDYRPFGGENFDDLTIRAATLLDFMAGESEAVLVSHGIFMTALATLLVGPDIAKLPPFALCGRLTLARSPGRSRWLIHDCKPPDFS